MFSISPAEFLTIAVIALIIFGPKRLGEMARQAGRLTGELRRSADELRSGIQTELDEVVKPVSDLRTDLAAAGKGLMETAEGELRWVDTQLTAHPAAEPAPTPPAKPQSGPGPGAEPLAEPADEAAPEEGDEAAR